MGKAGRATKPGGEGRFSPLEAPVLDPPLLGEVAREARRRGTALKLKSQSPPQSAMRLTAPPAGEHYRHAQAGGQQSPMRSAVIFMVVSFMAGVGAGSITVLASTV